MADVGGTPVYLSDLDTAWRPTRYRVYLCDTAGTVREEITDVKFSTSIALNEISTANVTAYGRKPGYFRPWLDCIAITGDLPEEVLFFGPVITARTKIVTKPEYSSETDIDCQGWEGWLDRINPRCDFQSDGDKYAWDAVYEVFSRSMQRAAKFQVVPTSFLAPSGSTRHQIPVVIDWDTDSDEARPGAPTAWEMIGDIHGQGIDVHWRPTYVDGRFVARCVIGGSTNTALADCKAPHTGRWLDREYVVGNDVGQLMIEHRGDMQATAVLASGTSEDWAVAPWSGVPPNPLVDWDLSSNSAWWAGILLESQIDLEAKLAPLDNDLDDPESVLRLYAERQRLALRKCPVFISELSLRFRPGDFWPGDCVVVADNGGAQLVTPESQIATRWALYGRINAINVTSEDMLFAELEMYQFDSEPSDLLFSASPGLVNLDFYQSADSVLGMTNRLSVRRR